MKLIQRKSKWQRLVEPLASVSPVPGAVRSGLATVGGMVAVTVASAVVSAVRHSQDSR